jgi:hypothetical protein
MIAFSLRPMEPDDGPAIDSLMREVVSTTNRSLTTHYTFDIYQSLLAQHPTLFGVVATAPGIDGLAGFATAFTDEVLVGGHAYPAGQLENLKLRADTRRQGLGWQLAAWRIDEARRRFGGDGIIHTGLETSNAASLAIARRWCTNVLGPVRVVIARTSSGRPPTTELRYRALEDRDVESVIESLDAFYAGYDLYPRMTPTRLAALLAPTTLGPSIRQYRIVEADDGTLIAGAMIGERFKVMVDQLGVDGVSPSQVNRSIEDSGTGSLDASVGRVARVLQRRQGVQDPPNGATTRFPRNAQTTHPGRDGRADRIL